MSVSRRTRLALLAVVLATSVLGAGWWLTTRTPRAEVVEDSTSQQGRKTIEYEGVRVDIPNSWERLDSGECEFQFERWGPPGTSACQPEAGVAFYGSATFDPAQGPGLRRAENPNDPPWGGYANAGELAVYVVGEESDTVQQVLTSVR